MAVEDLEWQERYGDQSYKKPSLVAIWITMLALHTSVTVVLPTMFVFLVVEMRSTTLMLGYSLAATCIGELCAGPVFSFWYDKRPAKEPVVAGLLVAAGGSFLYAVSPHPTTVILSRFLVGCGCGVQGVLWTMIGGLTNKHNRLSVIGSTRMLRILGYILGAGLAALASYAHDAPAPLDQMNRALPMYVGGGNATQGALNVTGAAAAEGASVWGLLRLGWRWGEGELGRELKMAETFEGQKAPSPEGGAWPKLVGGREVGDGGGAHKRSLLQVEGRGGGGGEGGRAERERVRLRGEAEASPAAALINEWGNWGGGLVGGPGGRLRGGSKLDAVMTDDEMRVTEVMGGHSFYIPSYITYIVGRDPLRAPGYLGCIVSVFAVVLVMLRLKEGPIKYLSQHVPMAHLNWRALECFTPLAACVGLETAAELFVVALETAVPPLIRMWETWTTDAVSIYLMGLASLGVLGFALQEPLQQVWPLRHLIFGAAMLMCLGTVYSVSWDGRLAVWRFTLGLSLASAAASPLSAMTNQVVNRAVVKTYSEEGAMVWSQLYWSITSVPARTLGPIGLSLALERDESGALAFGGVLVVALASAIVFVVLRSKLITPQVDEDAEVLPGSDPSITGSFEGVQLHRYAPLSP